MEWLALGANFLGGIMGYQADKASAKAAKALQAYNNTMTRLSDSINQNAITTNAVLAQDASAAQKLGLQRSQLQTESQLITSAAASETKGRSVNQAMFDIQRNGANREFERQQNLKNAFLAFDQQRLNSRMGATMAIDHSYIPKPNFMSYMLKAAMGSKDSISSLMG